MFRHFNKSIIPKLNLLWNKVRRLDEMRGDGIITTKRSGGGLTLGVNITALRRRLTRVGTSGLGGGENGTVIRASCTEDAPSDNTIAATIYQSDGSTGSAVSVYCNISNGTALNDAVPRLETGDDIFITKSTFDNAGTPETRWYCVTNFQASEDCTCEQADAVFNSVTIAEDQFLKFDGVGGDTYYLYNSSTGEMEHYVDGVKVTTW